MYAIGGHLIYQTKILCVLLTHVFNSISKLYYSVSLKYKRTHV